MTKTNWLVQFTEINAFVLRQTHELRKYARWQNAVFPSVKSWLINTKTTVLQTVNIFRISYASY